MNVKVVNFKNRDCIPLSVDERVCTIGDLKVLIESKARIPRGAQRLVYPARELSDEQKLQELQMKEGAFIYMVIRSSKKLRFQVRVTGGPPFALSMLQYATVKDLKTAIRKKRPDLDAAGFTIWNREDTVFDDSFDHRTLISLRVFEGRSNSFVYLRTPPVGSTPVGRDTLGEDADVDWNAEFIASLTSDTIILESRDINLDHSER